MTSKSREALDRYPLHIHEDDLEVTKQALRIAERLESGDVSDAMDLTAFKVDNEHSGYTEIFKAMAKVMIEEVAA